MESDHGTKVSELIMLHAFWNTQTSWISKKIYNLTPQHCPLYDTLWAMRLPPCMANHSSKPLFHAISPSINNDGYLVCYLPQNWPPVKAAIGHLPNQSSTTPASPVSKPVPSKAPHPPVTSTSLMVPSYIEALDQWIWSHFHTPFFFSSQPIPNQPSFSLHSIVFRSAPRPPSHHKILPWLVTLRLQFQDTAWDRWWYHNGVSQSWQEFPSLGPIHFNSTSTLLPFPSCISSLLFSSLVQPKSCPTMLNPRGIVVNYYNQWVNIIMIQAVFYCIKLY